MVLNMTLTEYIIVTNGPIDDECKVIISYR